MVEVKLAEMGGKELNSLKEHLLGFKDTIEWLHKKSNWWEVFAILAICSLGGLFRYVIIGFSYLIGTTVYCLAWLLGIGKHISYKKCIEVLKDGK